MTRSRGINRHDTIEQDQTSHTSEGTVVGYPVMREGKENSGRQHVDLPIPTMLA